MVTSGADEGVSFVVPIYNKRTYLPAVIEGLARQRGVFTREFIFIDDGSTDGSRDELTRLIAKLPNSLILSQSNRGPSIATNRGLLAARYPLVKLVDADDVLLPDAAAILREALIRHPDAVLAYGEGEGYSSPAEALARLERSPLSGTVAAKRYDALPALLRKCDLGPSACMVRAKIVRRVGGCDDRIFTQDYSLFLRLSVSGAFLHVAAPVTLCSLSTAGRVNDGGPQVLHDINMTLFYFFKEHAVSRHLIRKTVRRATKRAWRWAIRRENAKIFNRSLLLLIGAYLPFTKISLRLLRQSCAVFDATSAVRRI